MIAVLVGFFCLVTAVVFGYQQFGFGTGNLILGSVLLGLLILVFVWLKFFPDSRIARPFISQRAVGELVTARPELVNCTGVTITQLRPAGTAFINGKRVDVITEGILIDRGASIKVTAVQGARVVVREVL